MKFKPMKLHNASQAPTDYMKGMELHWSPCVWNGFEWEWWEEKILGDDIDQAKHAFSEKHPNIAKKYIRLIPCVLPLSELERLK